MFFLVHFFFAFEVASNDFFLQYMFMVGEKCNGSEEFMMKAEIPLSYPPPSPHFSSLSQGNHFRCFYIWFF